MRDSEPNAAQSMKHAEHEDEINKQLVHHNSIGVQCRFHFAVEESVHVNKPKEAQDSKANKGGTKRYTHRVMNNKICREPSNQVKDELVGV